MDLYTDQALTTMSQNWQNPDDSLIIPKLLPRVEVLRDNGTFPQWGREALVIHSDLTRTGKAKTREVGISRTVGNWGPLTEKALKVFIDHDQYTQYPTVFAPEAEVVNVLNAQMALNEEFTGASILTDPDVITNNAALTSSNSFLNDSTDPIKTIQTAAVAFRKKAFAKPNTMALSEDAYLALINHPLVIERFKYSTGGQVSESQLLSLLADYGITQIYRGYAQGNVSESENPTDEDVEEIWGDNVLLAKVTSQPGLMTVNGGYTLYKAGEKFVDKWSEQDPKGNWIRNNDRYIQAIFSTDVYYLITNVLAS